MKSLTVLYDGQCPLCCRCGAWLQRQPAFVPLVFLPLQAGECARRFPSLRDLHPERELVVISDSGEVWQGGSAWVMCLWALREYRELSQQLAHPALLPLARKACEIVSGNRGWLSRWLRPSVTSEDLRKKLRDCPDGVCGTSHGDISRR